MEKHITGIARTVEDAAGRPVKVMEDKDALHAAGIYGCGVGEIYRTALSLGICPARYIRNLGSITLCEQMALSNRTAAVVGAGGLGGYVITLLARVGVGSLIVIDPDSFDETNFNRQALSGMGALGLPKVEVAAATVADINPGVTVIPHQARFDFPEGLELLRGADVVIDALDNIEDRLSLQEGAAEIGIPLVHGAIAGFEGQVMTVMPGDAGLRRIYGKHGMNARKTARPEALLGTPAPAPALVATLEVMDVLKVLLGRDGVRRDSLLYIDMESGRMERFSLDSGE